MSERTDFLYRSIYATDASMYQMVPLAVATPSNRQELLSIMRRCFAEGCPMVPRGAGTSLTGQAVNRAQVLDLSKYMNRILQLNLDEGWVRVEPGVVCAELNSYLAPHGVHFAPDPATENRATIGGMISNNSAGMRSVRYGMTIDHVLELEVALANGDVVSFTDHTLENLDQLCIQPSFSGVLHRAMRSLINQHADLIRQRYPKVIRRSGGYALDALLDFNHFNLAKLLCGSEGTLGVVLEAKLRLTPLPKYSALCLAHFSSLDAALRAAPLTVQAGASAAELIDGVILHQARQHPLTRDICRQIRGDPAAVLIIEIQGNDKELLYDQIRHQSEVLGKLAYETSLVLEKADMAAVWQMRASALGLMATLQGTRKPTPYIEDAAVPPEFLADYVADVLSVCDRHGQPVSLFGHASVGLVHIRPLHDLHQPEDIATMEKIQAEVFPLVIKYGGSWSGEHGDGIVRGGFNREYFGSELYDAFEKIKRLFDPAGLMNPGKIVATPPMASNLRYGPAYQPKVTEGRFRYPSNGSLLAAAEQCNGVGACRKTLTGVMCPSYMATRDELHSTRGRANALRLALSGQLDDQGLASPMLAEAMNLCLACTGCKAECPSGVDMAKLKAEVLYEYQKKYGISLRTWLFANLSIMGRLACGPQAKWINSLLANKYLNGLISRVLGLDPTRSLPAFATQRLSEWFKRRSPQNTAKKTVLLFNDTYTEYFLPEVGRAAIECLEAAGYRVILATLGDSQRSAISLGLLDKARHHGMLLFKELSALIDADTPILVCEPSCASALMHDLPDLVEDRTLGVEISGRVSMIDVFLEKELAAGHIAFDWLEETTCSEPKHFIVHSHCHQKTIDGGRCTHKLLERIPGSVVSDTKAGCCGMAGSFGYEAEHADISRVIAAQRLLPSLNNSPTEAIVVSNGFSCRHQITELANRRSIHAVEALRRFIQVNNLGLKG